MIAALVDELIPGDAIWPSASAAGVHGIIALRLLSSWDTAALEKFADLIGWLNGSLSSDEPMQRTEAVAAFEVRDPDLF
ncbi:gluconate 2-dehydrogenase subunit 3 family protein [Ochrobactrum haematophilum]|uniref:Gluconate 2-dehydrogenase subunit 3 family protein n=3 Tax=Brucella TaxID=234 RepID=A0ABX1DS08_9HYPH|nr:gluconate 2-dehydrogenase subunit 3 family protein [Brucella haematophila]